jgi:aldehyde dehydrogenase (NAD+)
MRTYLNLIDGEWRAAISGKTLQTVNPADTGEIVAAYPASGKDDASAAIEAAKKSFVAWSAMTPVARGRILSKASGGVGRVAHARRRQNTT